MRPEKNRRNKEGQAGKKLWQFVPNSFHPTLYVLFQAFLVKPYQKEWVWKVGFKAE